MSEEQDMPGDEGMAEEQPASGDAGMAGDMGETGVTSDDRLWAAIGYPIVLVAIIVLFMQEKKMRPFIKYHAVQAIAFNLVIWVLYSIISVVSFGVGSICFPIVWLITLWPAYKAYQGEYMELPVISGILKNQGWTQV